MYLYLYVYCWIPAFFAIFMIDLSGAQIATNCSYEVLVNQTEFLRNERVTFVCSYNTPDVNLIRWNRPDMKDATAIENLFFRADPTDLDYGGPWDNYKGRVNGTFGYREHSVTVINASEKDFLFVQCYTYTADCQGHGVSDTHLILYASASFRRLGIVADGLEVYVNPLIRLSKNSFDVTFYAVSDPQSKLSVTGIDISGGQTCSRVDGDLTPPWNCSISATVTESVNISYTVSYMEVPQETRPLSIVFYENDGDADCECGPTESPTDGITDGPQKRGTGGMPKLEKVLIIVTVILAATF